MQNTVVIIGGGHAGFQLSSSLRRDGYEGRIVIFEKQNYFPYQRPPLSKAFLLGSMEDDRLFFRPPEFYSSNAIDIVFNEVTMVNRKEKKVIYEDGKSIYYDYLVFAVGVSPNKLNFCDLNYNNVYMFSDLHNAKDLKKARYRSKNILVIGTGFIGLEMASLAKKLDKEVHIISSGNQVLRRSISTQFSSVIKEQHISSGIRFFDDEGITDWSVKDNNIVDVTLSSKQTLPVDLIVVGIGSKPNVHLADLIGLTINDGIVVNDNLCTSDPSIYAIGDCVRFPYMNHSIRLESVQNTVDQARYLSQKILKKNLKSYRALPWFWSDQGDMKIQIAGVNPGISCKFDTITLNNQSAGYTCLSFLDGILAIVETINRPAVHMMAKKILSGKNIPTKSELSRYGFDLNLWFDSTTKKLKLYDESII